MGLGELNSGPALLSELDPAQEVHDCGADQRLLAVSPSVQSWLPWPGPSFHPAVGARPQLGSVSQDGGGEVGPGVSRKACERTCYGLVPGPCVFWP